MDNFNDLSDASERERLVGDELFLRCEFTACELAYERSLALHRENYKTLNNIGVLHERMGNTKLSISYYMSACSNLPHSLLDDSRYFKNLARACEVCDNTELTLWAYEKIITREATADYETSIKYLSILDRCLELSVDSQSIEALEKIFDNTKIDPQLAADVYYRIVCNDTEFCKVTNPEPHHILSLLRKYKITLHLLTTQIVTNPILETHLSYLRTHLLNLAEDSELNGQHHEILVILDAQRELAGGIHSFEQSRRITIPNLGAYAKPLKKNPLNIPSNKVRPSRVQPNRALLHSARRDPVRSQYEQYPYPFWTHRPHHVTSTLQSYYGFLGLKLPFIKPHRARILVAGCGTGQHAIQMALSYPDSQIIGIDISLASLQFAEHQRQKFQINNVSFIHCSIFDITSLNLKFKVIECIGVLHHLKQPARALKSLCSALENHGVIKLGLYSKHARSPIDFIKKKCKLHSIAYTPDNLSLIRDLAIKHYPTSLKSLIYSKDFYSVVGCMDLLFNPLEAPFTMRSIHNLITSQNLDFAGFELPDFSGPPTFSKFGSTNDLKSLFFEWHRYESLHPSTFGKMYTFWVRPRKKNENNRIQHRP